MQLSTPSAPVEPGQIGSKPDIRLKSAGVTVKGQQKKNTKSAAKYFSVIFNEISQMIDRCRQTATVFSP